LIGVVIGLLTIRLGNLYIALVTLTFSLLMERLVFTLKRFAQDGNGYKLVRPEFARTDVGFAVFAMIVFAIFAIFIVNLRRSTSGLAFNAVRWSETASRTTGLSVLQMKLVIAGLAAFVAGVGGGLFALQENQAIPADYATLIGLVWISVVVTFGVRSNLAALLAGVVLTLSPTFNTTILSGWLDDIGVHVSQTVLSVLAVFGFGVGAILVAKNPEGTLHMQAMQFQHAVQKRVNKYRPAPVLATAGANGEGRGEPVSVGAPSGDSSASGAAGNGAERGAGAEAPRT
jgi:branched-chain amino acid transport system permease protein